METFEARWLSLREPVDRRSRAGALIAPLKRWWLARGSSRVLDLGCGTGSNLRYLAPLLPGEQRWTLLDHDPSLLARVAPPADRVAIRPQRGDLGVEGLSAVTKSHLVTGSALLDLVSEAWLTSLAAACSASGCGVLFALSYDGRIEWGESTEDDELVRSAVNGHQRRDKGLGPALGPSAAPSADDLFRGHGYRTWLLPSPWRIGPDDAEIAVALLRGWAAAAAEERRGEAARVEAWASYRDTTIRDGDFRLRVGHLDLLALPEDQVQESS